ncbi:hypothetical protein Btru_054375 [Bulinus truncatus]|nr:hypothetical protein Btru_054375 [Bulinus truncatus]
MYDQAIIRICLYDQPTFRICMYDQTIFRICITTNPPLKFVCMTNPPLEYVCTTNPPLENVCTTNPPLEYVCTTNLSLEYVCTTNLSLESVCTTNPPLESVCTTNPPLEHECTTNPPLEHECTTNPPLEHERTTSPPLEHVCTTNPPLDHECTTNPPLEHECTTNPPLEHVCTTNPPLEYVCTTNLSLEYVCTTNLSLESVCTTNPPLESVCTTNPPLEHECTTNPPLEHECTTNPPLEHVCTTNPPLDHECTTNPPLKHECTTNPPLEHVCTTNPPLEHECTTNPPLEHECTTNPPLEHECTTNPPLEHECTTNPPLEHKCTTNPPLEHVCTTNPPLENECTTNPPLEHECTTNPPLEHECTTNPPLEHELPPSNLSPEEKDVLCAALEMLTNACKENETNQQLLFSHSDLPIQILSILLFNFKGQGRLLKIACLNLLHEISLTSTGRATIVSKFDVDSLTAALFPMMVKSSTYGSTAAAVLNNIALDKRLKSLLRDRIEEKILPAFESLMKSNTPPGILSLATSAATNLSGDQIIRNKMAARQELWENVGHLLECYINSKLIVPLEYLLGLLLNLSTNVPPSSLQLVCNDVVKNCHSIIVSGNLSDLVVSRALSVLSNLLTHCDTALSYLSTDERPLLLLDFMKHPDPAFYKPALKCLSVLTQNSEQIKQMIADNKGTSVLLNFLIINDEVVIGNAALCLSHLIQLKKVCSKLTKSNIIQKLLELARDGKKPTVQSNCAILVGKLVQGDSRHLDRLRELHGIEILHSCMKYLK